VGEAEGAKLGVRVGEVVGREEVGETEGWE
jgi:hypothetical protein